MRPARPAAYGGPGWKPRRRSLGAELAGRAGLWAPFRVDAEYKRLEAVLLYTPGAELRSVRDPDAALHLERIDVGAIRREHARIEARFRAAGVAVHRIERPFDGRRPPKPNLMYVRDLFFPTPEGAIVSRMASAVRAGEERHAAAALAALGVPILATISGLGRFEGADALWLDSRTVVCGVGGRTNAEGFRQLRETLRRQGVAALAAPMPRGVQHLLGLLQIVDARLALLRAELAPAALRRLLRRRGFRLIDIRECDEVSRRQGMNVVTIAPRTVLMPKDCPGLRARYASEGLRVAGELDLSQTIRGAGGLACMTGVLSRRP